MVFGLKVSARVWAAARAFSTLLVLLWPLSAGHADEGTGQPVLRMGYEEFRPYSFTDENGQARGYSIDLIRYLTEPYGYQLEFVSTRNPGEMLALLEGGEIDLTSLLSVTPERRLVGAYTSPLGSFQNSLFVLDGSPATSPEHLIGRKIGVVAGSFAVTAARTISLAKIVEIPDQEKQLVALLSGAVDAVSTATETFQAELRRLGLESRVRVLSPPLLERPRGFMVRPDLTGVLAELNAAIESRLQRGDLIALNQRWFGRDRTVLDHPDFKLYAAAAAMVAVVVILAFASAWFHSQRAKKSFAEGARNRLLVDALNTIDLSVIIYNKALKAIHWNDAVIRNFPDMVPRLRRGTTMRELIGTSYLNGTAEAAKEEGDARAFAEKIIEDVIAAKDVTRTIRMSDGRIYEACELRLGLDFYVSVRKDVTRIELQAEEIRAQREQLAEANRKLTEFSAVAAHDLRAPLRQQEMLLDYIVEDLHSAGLEIPEVTAHDIAAVKTSFGKMSGLVEDLLCYAKAEEARDDIETFDPAARMPQIMSLAAVPEAFRVEVAANLPRIRASVTSFDTVLRNLIANAVKHHDGDHGLIRIRGTRDGSMATIEVEDDGPGIPLELRERIFDPFKSFRSGSRTPGSGLGLSVIKRMVEGWGGAVSACDNDSGGATFRFTVPCGSDAPDVKPPHPANVVTLHGAAAHSGG